MYTDGKIWLANNDKGEKISILPKMANRHGLIAGATGTGKTVTVKVLAETFSDMGVPVFLADVKGDLASVAAPGENTEDMQERIRRFGLAEAGFAYQGYPVTLWDIFGQKGIQLRTTISEIGPMLLSRILGLNDLQSDILSVVFKIADDNGYFLIDTKDLKAMLNYVNENHKQYEMEYGRITTASVSAIIRAIVALESEGGDIFFGEPALQMHDWLTLGEGGRGMINILDSESLINNGRLYSTFLLWMMAELFEAMPEVGDLEKPKMVFFFDEAHLLFNDASKPLLDKIEQVVKLIRSKGIGIYFCTQNPRDIPDGVLAQLGNKIQHGLHAYTPTDQKAVRAAADSFRVNPEFDTYETLLSLGKGEAVVSFLQEDGTPGMAQKVAVLPPRSRFGTITESERASAVQGALLYGKYAAAYDAESAYEMLARGQETYPAQSAAEGTGVGAAPDARDEKIKELEAQLAAQQKAEAERLKELEKQEKKKKKAIKSAGKTVAGSIGREFGKTIGGAVGGKTGKTIFGNLGASLGRGFMDVFSRD